MFNQVLYLVMFSLILAIKKSKGGRFNTIYVKKQL